MDIVWVLDGSSSMEPIKIGEYEYEAVYSEDRFAYLRGFLMNFTDTVEMSPSAVRQGYLEYSGEVLNGGVVTGTILGPVLNVTDQIASDKASFLASVASLSPIGGTTNTPFAIDYVRNNMFTSTNRRENSFRIVILVTDGFPTDNRGLTNPSLNTATENAAVQLRDEDDVIFIFVKVGTDYPVNWFNQVAEKVYEVASFSQLYELLERDDFLCLYMTHGPTTSPATPQPTSNPTESPVTSTPSIAPTATTLSPTTSPQTSHPSHSPTTSLPSASPTQCSPGLVTCCVSCGSLRLPGKFVGQN